MGYKAPELLTGNLEYDQSIDVFSLGVFLYILATGEMPFHGSNKSSIRKMTVKREP